MKKIDDVILTNIKCLKQQEFSEAIVFVSNIKLAYKLFDKKNVVIVKSYPFINALCVLGNIHTICSLSKYNFVTYISALSNVEALVDVSKKVLNCNTLLTGKNVTIAYIDTGIRPHLDFVCGENRIIKFKDFVNQCDKPYDDNGHGTFVSGVGSGNGLISNGLYKGFAWKSNIVSVKALDNKGEASASKILESMQWIYDNHKVYDIKVVCMSFGSEPLGFNDPIMKGAEMLWKSGITIVSAAGNSGPHAQSIKSPAVSSKIISVGGMDDNRMDNKSLNSNFYEIADFSSRGPAFKRHKPDLVTPSVSIVSCKYKDGFYTSLSGTSVATPMVAGIIALAYEKNKNLKPDFIKKCLLASCKPITFNRNWEGNGLLNAEKFLSFV